MKERNGYAVLLCWLLLAGAAGAQGMMGGGSGMANGTGMTVVASDGSLLVTQMGMSMMGSPTAGGGGSLQRAIVDLGPDGKQRWQFAVTSGWPMMAANNGDLVVVIVMNNAWMWRSLSGMGWFPFGTPAQGGSQDATAVGLDLATGAQRWSATLPGDMGSYPQFSGDGSKIYISVTDFGSAGMMGSGSMRQGDTGGWATQMTNKIVALSRAGAVLWTTDLSQGGGMMP